MLDFWKIEYWLRDHKELMFVMGIGVILFFWGVVIYHQHKQKMLFGKISYILLLISSIYAITWPYYTDLLFVGSARRFMGRTLQILWAVCIAVASIHFYFFSKK